MATKKPTKRAVSDKRSAAAPDKAAPDKAAPAKAAPRKAAPAKAAPRKAAPAKVAPAKAAPRKTAKGSGAPIEARPGKPPQSKAPERKAQRTPSERGFSLPDGDTPEGVGAAIGSLLDEMLDGQIEFVIVEATRCGNHYVQFAPEKKGMVSEAVSNKFLKGDERLDADALRKLEELGWVPPKRGRPNFYRLWGAPVATAEAARLAARTLAEVYHVSRATDAVVRLGGAEPVPLFNWL